ncbi:unnamed protein product [Thelazia callipaeda]|uniref:Zinc finger, CCHC-type n=1 Tax=Thelazia callipaeda TaxID=103827 RepID=A0A0N5CTD2_THECL|nr:unnamed protein product [Thelazia callipaeda]
MNKRKRAKRKDGKQMQQIQQNGANCSSATDTKSAPVNAFSKANGSNSQKNSQTSSHAKNRTNHKSSKLRGDGPHETYENRRKTPGSNQKNNTNSASSTAYDHFVTHGRGIHSRNACFERWLNSIDILSEKFDESSEHDVTFIGVEGSSGEGDISNTQSKNCPVCFKIRMRRCNF